LIPEIVTFWHGPLDRLRQTCLRSQVAAGHKVTVYSFDTVAGLPEGVDSAEAERILPRAFAERLRPPTPDGSWNDRTRVQFSDFFRMRLQAERAGLWLDADVLLLRPIEIDPAKPYFAWERPRQLGNSVLYLPPDDPIVEAFENLIRQEELTPDWLAMRHRLNFAMQRLRGGTDRVCEIRVAIYGPPSLTALAKRSGELHHALPRKSFYAVHSTPKRFFEPSNFSTLIADPKIYRPAYLPKGPLQPSPDSRKPLRLGGGNDSGSPRPDDRAGYLI